MALYRYFSRNEGCLPDPKGSLQTAVPSHAIEAANREVGRIQDEVSHNQKKEESIIDLMLKLERLLVNMLAAMEL